MRLVSLTLLTVLACTSALGLPANWHQTLDEFDRVRIEAAVRAVARGVVSYSSLPLPHSEHRRVSPVQTLQSTGAIDDIFEVMLDPSLKDPGKCLYDQRTIVLGPAPLLLRATALEHEVFHSIQMNPVQTPAWLHRWRMELQERIPNHPGTYILEPRELEVRIWSVTVIASILDEPIERPDDFLKWMSLLGGPPFRDVPPLSFHVINRLKASFPDAFDLVALFPQQAGSDPRQQSLLAYCAEIAPALY